MLDEKDDVYWEEQMPDEELDCESCEHYDHDEGCCSAWTCNPFDCGTLPCEES